MVGKSVVSRLSKKIDKITLLASKVIIDQLQKPESKQLLEEQNRQQLSKSGKSDGQSITPLYSASYAKKKGFKKPDLKLSGDFYKSITANVTAKETVFTATDKKTPFLKSKYTDEILGIQDKRKIIIIRFIEPSAFREYKKVMI